MNRIDEAKVFIRTVLGYVPGVTTTPELRKRIETADLPACYVLTQQGLWSHDSTETPGHLRTFRIECLVNPLPSDLAEVNERLVDSIIEGIVAAFHTHQTFGDGCLVHLDEIEDSGLLLLDHGTTYYGFTMDIPIFIR